MDENNDDNLNDILLGIGAGAAQSDSPFVRSFGTSLATTVGSKERRKSERQKKQDEIEAEQRREESVNRLAEAASSRQIDAELEMRRRISEMYKGKKANVVSPGIPDFVKDFVDMFGKFVPKAAKPKGAPRVAEPPPSPMRRPPGVELVPFDEGSGSSTSSGSTSGSRNTYIDSKGVRRYTDTGQPFGTF